MTKIDANYPVPVTAALRSVRPSSGGTPAGAVAGTAAAHGIGATAASAVETSRATAPAGSAPFDAAKVARVRAAVLDGSYTPDAGRIAQRMLDLERKLP